MRFIYKVVLGLMIFNSVLLLLAGYFPTSGSIGKPVDVTGDSDYTKYKIGGTQSLFTFGGTSAAIMGFSLGLGVISMWLVKSTIPLAACGVGGVVTALYVGPAAVLLQITQNAIVTGIISLIGVLLGIMVGFMIIEWFANQQGID